MTDGAVKALRLMAWLSPGYPVGAYAYSHGLEAAVEAGDVRDEAGLSAWLDDVCARGSLRNDLILAAHARRAAAAGDAAGLDALNALALALAPSRELHLETSQQGRSFLDATLGAWPCPDLHTLAHALDGSVAYPVAVGAAAGAHGMAPGPVLAAYGLAFVQNLVSAALRAAPVGQAAGTRVVAALTPAVAGLAAEAERADLDALGSACFRLDLGSFRHETQYSRIFRS
ncbi:urease accessory UreF family protein [Methylobacterium sp. NEAU 140]|uniref:urease accessory protein UreF n=1 Tax=Methylobacterium sp. NEAU 140 TaxID=3064945 RepID=UPI00273754E9|nr:urease accessory UreF family protein [Methylobacterium sp. NEAU 140]MDP4024811.1 urease accessory UreF family protein [Methylobacterium sp. NEAU 140]